MRVERPKHSTDHQRNSATPVGNLSQRSVKIEKKGRVRRLYNWCVARISSQSQAASTTMTKRVVVIPEKGVFQKFRFWFAEKFHFKSGVSSPDTKYVSYKELSQLMVKGEVQCEKLVFDSDLTVTGDGQLQELKKLSVPIEIHGNLFIVNCSEVTSLNDSSIKVSGDLNINFCDKLDSLTGSLEVNGSIYIYGCRSVVQVADDITVRKNISLSICPAIESLCTNLTMGPTTVHRVLNSITVDEVASVKSFAKNIRAEGDLIVRRMLRSRHSVDCEISSLATSIQVLGDFKVIDCNTVETISEQLLVGRNFDIGQSKSIKSLPPDLRVVGNVNLSGCKELTSLSENFQSEGDIDLEGCSGITSLPNSITDPRQRAQRRGREIYLHGTRVPQSATGRTEDTFHFELRRPDSASNVKFSSLDEAFEFWNKQLPDNISVKNPHLSVETYELESICNFLAGLTKTAEYKNNLSKLTLARRVVDLMRVMADEPEIKELALELIRHGQTSCDDRLISAMDELELQVIVHQTVGEDNLKSLARGIVLLEKVRARALDHANSLEWVDEIEVVLAFQTVLKKVLDLPLSTEKMIFRSSAQITDEEILRIGDEIRSSTTDDEVAQFMADWAPWKKHQRLKKVKKYDELPITNIKVDDTAICLITLAPLDEIEEPLVYDGNVYEYKDFAKHFVNDGRDPGNRNPIDFSKVSRMQKAKGN